MAGEKPKPEVRLDQLTGLRTILAPARADRPNAFVVERRPLSDPDGCPFCEEFRIGKNLELMTIAVGV